MGRRVYSILSVNHFWYIRIIHFHLVGREVWQRTSEKERQHFIKICRFSVWSARARTHKTISEGAQAQFCAVIRSLGEAFMLYFFFSSGCVRRSTFVGAVVDVDVLVGLPPSTLYIIIGGMKKIAEDMSVAE